MFRSVGLALAAARPVLRRGFAGKTEKVAFKWEDPLDLHASLKEEERMIVDQVRAYAQERLMPRVTMAYRNEVRWNDCCYCVV